MCESSSYKSLWLYSIHWIASAWEKIFKKTIENCFIKAGFGTREAIDTMEELASLEIEQELELQALLDRHGSVYSSIQPSASPALDFDNDLPTFETFSVLNLESQLVQSHFKKLEAITDENDDHSSEPVYAKHQETAAYTSQELIEVFHRLKSTASLKSPDSLCLIQRLETNFVEDLVSNVVQTKFTSFFT